MQVILESVAGSGIRACFREGIQSDIRAEFTGKRKEEPGCADQSRREGGEPFSAVEAELQSRSRLLVKDPAIEGPAEIRLLRYR